MDKLDNLEPRVSAIRRRFDCGDMVLRHEEKGTVLFGNTLDRYRIFQLYISPFAALILEQINKGFSAKELFAILVSSGANHNKAIEHIENTIDIADFDRSNLAIKYGVIEEVLSAPINVTWDIINTCNLTCSYCYNSSGPVRDNSLSVEKCLDIVDQIADLGVHNVWIGGGEPLMKKGIDKVLRRLKQKNVKVLLATNGTFLTKPRFRELVAETCTEVNLSVDGHTQELHSLWRGKSAKLSDVTDAVDLMRKDFGDKIFFTAITVVHTKNLNSIPEIIDWCHANGFNKWTHNELYSLGRGNSMNKYVLAHKEYEQLYEICSLKEREYRNRMVVEDYVRMNKQTPSGEVKPFYGCVAGNQELAIQHKGDVYPCQKLQYPKYHCGNLKEVSLSEIWKNNPVITWLRQRNIEDTECTGCKIFESGRCNGGCLAEKEIHFNRHDTRDPMCPENKGIYRDYLLDNTDYPYSNKPIREKFPVEFRKESNTTWRELEKK